MANQISADIPDIKENLEYHWDLFGMLFSTQHKTTLASNVFGPTNGSNYFSLPTNGVSDDTGVFMTGDTDTIIWMYLNAAPPGWKVLATGADTVLGIAGGAAAYNVAGGNPDSAATWTYAHNHIWVEATGTGTDTIEIDAAGDDQTYQSDGSTPLEIQQGADLYTKLSTDNTWRPAASVGKLFQLNTA